MRVAESLSWTAAGPTYEDFDFGLTGAEPAHPGVYLYAITKGLGQEICRVFAANTPSLAIIHLMFCAPTPATWEPRVEGAC
eukprot:SAG11_NODE_1187_length_5588_cov_6.285662_3_plen_81_part_00